MWDFRSILNESDQLCANTIRPVLVHYPFSPWFERQDRATFCCFSCSRVDWFSHSCQFRKKRCSFNRISTSHWGMFPGTSVYLSRGHIFWHPHLACRNLQLELASVIPYNNPYFHSSYSLICRETCQICLEETGSHCSLLKHGSSFPSAIGQSS